MRYIILLLALYCQSVLAATHFSQQALADFASKSTLNFSVVSNQLDQPMRFNAKITLDNNSEQALPAGISDWHIYFHLIRHIETVELEGVKIEHVQGDLHRISPTESFKGLAPHQQLNLPFSSAPWLVSYSDFMPRAFIVADQLQAEVFANTNTEDFSHFVKPLTEPQQLLRNFDEPDQVPIVNAASRFAYNTTLAPATLDIDVSTAIIPTPLSASFSQETIQLNSTWQLQFDSELAAEASYLQQQLIQLGVTLNTAKADANDTTPKLFLKLDKSLKLGAEGYQLSIKPAQINLHGKDRAGTFYAIQSLLSLAQHSENKLTLPVGKINDQPRASWRGMHYDMARNFHGKDVTLRLIDQMARYKLNKLHVHLTEDEGWRLQIPGLPELTDIGAKRCFDLTEQHCLLTQLGTGPNIDGTGNGYYSTTDFIDILRYAAERHIEVIPEIDLPGHARAAIVSMKARYNRLMAQGQREAAEQYLLSDAADTSSYLSVQNYNDNSANVCLPSTYAFVEKVLHELQDMYKQAGVRFSTYHMGGDEVAKGSWSGSPACQLLFSQSGNGINTVDDLKPYFVSKVAAITRQRGLALAGWEDGLMYDQQNTFDRSQFSNNNVIANAWDNIWEWGVADRAYRLANNGYQVVLSPGTHLYFDHPHEAHPDERGYYWATRFIGIDKVFGFMPDNLYANASTTRSGAPITDLAALLGRELPELHRPENILGIQGQVWSETIRTAEQLEQMIYPRLLALAERAWHKADWETTNNASKRKQDWQRFAARVGKVELHRLAKNNSSFYLPPPGATKTNNGWQLNTALPFLTIECSVNQGKNWHSCTSSNLQQSTLWLRSRHGNIVSRIVSIQG